MSKLTQVSVLAVALVMASVSASWAESLQDAVQMTVSSHPQVGIVANDRKAIDEELNQANALYLPQVDAEASMGVARTARWGQGNNAATDDGDILPNARAQVTLQQMLFDGYNASSEVERQENRVRSAAHRVKETAELVGLDAVEAYLNVLRARQLVEIASENLQDHRALLGDIERRADAGAGTGGDVEQAKARVAQAEAALLQVQGDLDASEISYNRTVGRFPGDLMRPAPISADLLPVDEDMAVEVALKNNPTLALRDADVAVAAAELKQTQSTLYPQVSLEGIASKAKDQNGLRTSSNDVGGGVVMRWNLYRGGADMARKREHQWRQAEAQNQHDDAIREVEQLIRTDWSARDIARQRAERYAEQVEANKKVLGAYRKQFDSSERTLLDVLDARNELFVSTSSMISAYYTAMFGDYQILADSGALLSGLSVNAPQAATLVSAE
jgi:adhesin transport system outer membrane protein